MLSMPRIVRPDPSSILGRNLVPPLDRQPCRSIKRNKELSKLSYLTNPESSQAPYSQRLSCVGIAFRS